MEEELNENELEERFYSMLHYVDGSQTNADSVKDGSSLLANPPRATLQRYWRPGDSHHPYRKVNTPKETPNTNKQPLRPNNTTDKAKPKEEKHEAPPEPLPAHLAFFQLTVPQRNSIEILEDVEANVVELESSDEDEVIEVALPPKPTITIESSDEEEKPPSNSTAKSKEKPPNREVSASPVPSVVSSMSDEFIRGDCIALNISSCLPDDHSFDFGLHGADLLGQSTPSKKKKKKKNKEATSTPIVKSTPTNPNNEECFATPKSKAKNKRQITKSYTVKEKSIPNPDVYDSDSNQSIIDANKTNSFIITDRTLPSVDVYESDSVSELLKNTSKPNEITETCVASSDSSTEKLLEAPVQLKRANPCNQTSEPPNAIVDLTDISPPMSYNIPDIQENITIGNVSGFAESEDYGDEPASQKSLSNLDPPKFGSTKVPAILYDNLDFDNLKGKDKICKNRRYSLTTLRAEMEKFYNESWGGEDFNHKEIQKNMSRDKSLWAIDPKDRMPRISKRKIACNYCGRIGHRDDMCRFKPPVCYMCGNTGHIEPRCPSKICVNCGSPNNLYSAMCSNCCQWGRLMCSECGQNGHPASHCPDLWRRYHNTIDITAHLEENRYNKKHNQLFCSGCTRRGHLVHTCRVTLPFSGLPMNSPFVCWYAPIYRPNQENMPQNEQRQAKTWKKQQDTVAPFVGIKGSNKRQSKSPTIHETHASKKRNVDGEVTESKSPNRGRKLSQSKEAETKKDNEVKIASAAETVAPNAETAPDFILITSTNRDKQGQIIQDNEVSDTSDIVTSARVYVTTDIIDKLKTDDGAAWLKETTDKFNVTVHYTDIHSFLSIQGKVINQEEFQTALREWAKPKPSRESTKSDNEVDVTQDSDHDQSMSHNIPKNRYDVLRKLNKALKSLKQDLGDPNAIYRELNYLQNRHEQLLKQKVINPQQLDNNRDHINEMLKKLNMVLLGQAGLAEGRAHLTQLNLLQEKLINFRQKNLSLDLRATIGKHYHTIFTATPRSDYQQLVQSYYRTTQSPNKKKRNSFKLNAKTRAIVNAIPSQQKDRSNENKGAVVENKIQKFPKIPKKPLVQKTIHKLSYMHKKLLKAQPTDSIRKKEKGNLVRKIHTHLAAYSRNGNMTSKTLKKLKKIQDWAQTFLNSV